jgi:cytochrome b6-f complex iron-sulfur subunit
MLRPGRKDKKNSSSLLKTIGSVEDFPKNSVTPDRINKFFLIRADDGGFLALSLTCSHLGCSLPLSFIGI